MDLKSDLLGLKSKLMNIEKDFSEKLTTVSEKEEVGKRIEEKVTELVESKKKPLINLNIGGKIFSTKMSTLLSCKETIFFTTLSKMVEEGTPIPEEIFYDRSYQHFELILNYLRTKTFNIKGYNRFEKEDIREEVAFYGLAEVLQISKREDYDLAWDQSLSKSGTFTIDTSDNKLIKIHSTTCYTHFVTNRAFSNEDFQIELEVSVTQSDNYLYVGIYNGSYSLTGNCGCCNPANAFYLQCDGSIHINGTRTENSQLAWNSQKIIIGMKVYNSTKKIYFYFPGKNDLEIGPYNLTGANFRVYAGHCSAGNGEIKILDCYAIKD